ncbi:polysaccharide deacetylase family protein [Actinoplanes sp. TRM 88003]|uniref:Polysaccharide deacetylase family protein n=1 Tax=Paractinoplanes aksuensis TaxID=2939490 RepID=A0ABT1E4B2_9ACTN|nr:polysaccharide deacetylase family protein [Actinoplanes aksuensis]MCO8277954.1 polysaccharide deacetylase family protein [Actinoplanes aksuensis]
MRMRALAAALLVAVVAGCGAGEHPVEPAPSTSATVTPSLPTVTPPKPQARAIALSHLPANLRARVPQFAPAPPATTKVQLPTDGTAGWFSRIPTDQKVAFITIDDGWVKHPLALPLFQAADVPVTLFLQTNAIRSDPQYFAKLQAAGATIENHTITHPNLEGRSYAAQKREICGGADQLAGFYGRRPVLFRPPFGNHDRTTLKASHDCGMKAAFFWKETTNKGKVRFQEGPGVKPGDIILMHFRDRFPDDFTAVLQAIHKAGLTPAKLEDYIP